MFDYILLVNRQGKVRLSRWYHPALTISHRTRIAATLPTHILTRTRSRRTLCNILHFPSPHHPPPMATCQIIYKRYASLFFLFALSPSSPPSSTLLALDLIHRFVETLDGYFGSVCELDLVFNFHKTAYILDEMFVGGKVVEGSLKSVLLMIKSADDQEAREKEEAQRAIAPNFLSFQ